MTTVMDLIGNIFRFWLMTILGLQKTSSDQCWEQSNHPSVSLLLGRLFSAVVLPVTWPSLPENTVDGPLSMAVCSSLPGRPSAIPQVGKKSVDLELFWGGQSSN